MGPALPIFIVLAALGIGVSSCSSKSDGGNGGGDVDSDADVDSDTDIDADTDSDIPDGGDADTDTEDTNPCDDRAGINGSYYKCMRGTEPCSMLDLDLYGNTMRFVSSSNHLARIDVDASDTLGLANEAIGTFSNNFFAGNTFNTLEGLKPLVSLQSDRLSEEDGLYGLYFMYEGTIYPDTSEEATAMVSGIAVFDGVTSPMSDPEMVQGVNPMVVPYDMYFSDIRSSVMYTDGLESRLGMVATEPVTGLGVFLGYGFNGMQWLVQGDFDFPVLTSGNYPSAVALLSDAEGEKRIAVVSTEGGSESWQVPGASIDIIDPTVSAAATTESSALSSKVGQITFGDDVTLKPFNELPIAEIGGEKYGVVVGGAAGDHRTLYVVSFETNSVVSSLDLSDSVDAVNGIALKGTTVALTVESGDHRDGDESLITISIADPAAPAVQTVIANLGWGLTVADIHEASGTVYIAAKASFCEAEPASDAPYSTMLAVDPAVASSY